jgi:hypothetical protein
VATALGTFDLFIRHLGMQVVTVLRRKGQSTKVSRFCHYSPVKMSEIRGNQVRSKTVQVLGWKEDLLWIVDLAKTAESV